MSFLFFFTHSGRSLLGGLLRGSWLSFYLCFLNLDQGGSGRGGTLGSVGELE